MALGLIRFLEALTGILALCGIGYYALCLWSARAFLQDSAANTKSVDPVFMPPVSILKPLRGTDRQMYESLRSHCLQDYPDYELIFGVAEPDDPALPMIEQLKQEFPAHRIRLVMCPEVLGTNLKVSNLVQMLPCVAYDHLIVNDSDIRVEPDYLRRVMAPLANPEVGLVTTLYRGAAGRTLGSKLESLGISSDFSAGVLAARQVEGGIHFALGSTLALTRPALNAIGGFEPLLDYLADDFELGYRIAAAKYKVVLSDVVVDTFLPDYGFKGFWQHQQRWARSTRDSRRWGYLGVSLTFGLPWALLAVIVSGGAIWSWALLTLASFVRAAMALVVGLGVLHDKQITSLIGLLPLRDVMALVIWTASYAGHTIAWRGNHFVLENGKMRPT